MVERVNRRLVKKVYSRTATLVTNGQPKYSRAFVVANILAEEQTVVNAILVTGIGLNLLLKKYFRRILLLNIFNAESEFTDVQGELFNNWTPVCQ